MIEFIVVTIESQSITAFCRFVMTMFIIGLHAVMLIPLTPQQKVKGTTVRQLTAHRRRCLMPLNEFSHM